MNTLRNKVQLIGNLGNDPEIITLDSGKKLAKFSLATNESLPAMPPGHGRIANGGYRIQVPQCPLETQERDTAVTATA